MLRAGESLDALVSTHGGVLSTAEARAAGVTRAAVEWAIRRKMLKPLRFGVYTSTRLWNQAGQDARHLLTALAHQRVNPNLVTCATSAAIALKLPTPEGSPAQPQLTTPRGVTHRGAPGLRSGALGRRSWLANEQIVVLKNPRGLRVTSPIRTVLDCARHWERPWGLAIADAAVSQFHIEPSHLLSAAESFPRSPGRPAMLWVAKNARARVESPLESLARAVVVLAGLPEPVVQVEVATRAGTFRVDLLDVENRVIIEADGKLKYATPEDVWREKRREDALRDALFEVVRFTMPDYTHFTSWLEIYRQALARSAKRRQVGL